MALPPSTRPPRTVPAKGDTRRRYPRTSMQLKAKILVFGAKKQDGLEAVLDTSDISMTGIFFESTFFMKVGTRVQVQFSVPRDKRRIVANGFIVREERPSASGRGVQSGFAVHFTEFVDDSAVVLASLFLAPRVRGFVERYIKMRRDDDLQIELDRLIDVVVGWELAKTESEDVWEETFT